MVTYPLVVISPRPRRGRRARRRRVVAVADRGDPERVHYRGRMRPAAFDDLTAAGRVRRLRRLVPQAVAHHDVDVTRVRLAAEAFNTMFRIDACNGRRYALRVAAPWHLNADGIAEVEAVWAAALAADTAVAPPQVVRTRDGAASVSIEADGVPARASACSHVAGGPSDLITRTHGPAVTRRGRTTRWAPSRYSGRHRGRPPAVPARMGTRRSRTQEGADPSMPPTRRSCR